MKLSQKNAVSRYGTDATKNYFKEHNKLKTEHKNAIIQELKRRYRDVTTEGRPYVFVCESKIGQGVQDKEDNRGTDSKYEQRKQLDCVLAYLTLNDTQERRELSLKSLLKHFYAITPREYLLLSFCYNSEDWTCYKNTMDIPYIEAETDEELLQDYIKIIRSYGGLIISGLQRLDKANVIKYSQGGKVGKYVKDEKKNELVAITKSINVDILSKIKAKESELLKKHDTTKQAVNKYWYTKKIQAYNQEWLPWLSKIEIEEGKGYSGATWYFDTHIIEKGNWKKEKTGVLKYLARYFKDEYPEDKVKIDEIGIEKYIEECYNIYKQGRLERETNKVSDKKFKLEREHYKKELKFEDVDKAFQSMVELGLYKKLSDRIVDNEHNTVLYLKGLWLDTSELKADGTCIKRWEFNCIRQLKPLLKKEVLIDWFAGGLYDSPFTIADDKKIIQFETTKHKVAIEKERRRINKQDEADKEYEEQLKLEQEQRDKAYDEMVAEHLAKLEQLKQWQQDEHEAKMVDFKTHVEYVKSGGIEPKKDIYVEVPTFTNPDDYFKWCDDTMVDEAELKFIEMKYRAKMSRLKEECEAKRKIDWSKDTGDLLEGIAI